MVLPRPLVLFLSFCGGAALFVTPLLLAALALGGSGAPAGAAEASGGSLTPSTAAADPDAIVGEITITAFDMGFEPAMAEVAVAGRYSVTVVNDGAIPHDVTFADGTTIAAAAGATVAGEVAVPADGIGFICSVPGHEAAGMSGHVMVAGAAASAAPSPSGDATPPTASVAPDPAAPAYTPRDAIAPARADGTVHDVELVMTERLMTVADGYQQLVWTFGDEVPGPVMRVTVGDTVRVTIKNPATNQMSHSIDFHASMVAWNDEMRSIAPGEELVYEYVAEYAGVFMYHCGTAPALHHIANGMYGMIIVEPEGGLPPVDHEFALVQSEWYLGPQGQITDLAKAGAAAPAPDFVVWNGIANQYLDHPIEVPVGDTVRVFVLNAGPNVDSSFHVVGTIFHSVIKEGVQLREGNDGNWGAQAVDLSPAQGAIVEMRFAEDGLYPIVTHAFNFVGKGALGLFKAGDGGAPMAGGH
jgi:nitrite reductase (NO-forming)